MEFTQNVKTKKFVADVASLRSLGVIRFDSEISEAIGTQKSNLSAILNGKRNGSEELLSTFYEKYGSKLSDNKLASGSSNAVLLEQNDFTVMMVPLVNKYAYAGYQAGYGDDEYVETLPKVPMMVDKERKGVYRAFEIRGDSMNNGLVGSYAEGYVAYGREIPRQHWRNKIHFKSWPSFIVVTKTDGILIKEITKHNVEKGIITLHSWNEEYPDIEMSLDDVAQLFNTVDVSFKK